MAGGFLRGECDDDRSAVQRQRESAFASKLKSHAQMFAFGRRSLPRFSGIEAVESPWDAAEMRMGCGETRSVSLYRQEAKGQDRTSHQKGLFALGPAESQPQLALHVNEETATVESSVRRLSLGYRTPKQGRLPCVPPVIRIYIVYLGYILRINVQLKGE